MTDHSWPTEVSGQLGGFLADTFAGVEFHAAPLVAQDIVTIDVAWTDGPSLHEVDLLALEFVLRIHLDRSDTPVRLSIDRISKRRTMSPSVEATLLKILATDMGVDPGELGKGEVYPLPPVLGSARYSAERGTVSEFLDLLFEATSFDPEGPQAELPVGAVDSLACRCVLCA